MSDARSFPDWVLSAIGLLTTFVTLVAGALGYHWRRLDRVIENQIHFVTKEELSLIFGRMNDEGDRRHQQNLDGIANLSDRVEDSAANLTARIDRVLEKMK